MVVLATGVDGTTTAGLDIPVPDVTPYSKIYFLQLWVSLSLLFVIVLSYNGGRLTVLALGLEMFQPQPGPLDLP